MVRQFICLAEIESVNTKSTNAQLGLLNTVIKDFENLDFEKICGQKRVS